MWKRWSTLSRVGDGDTHHVTVDVLAVDPLHRHPVADLDPEGDSLATMLKTDLRSSA
jgi:hypothetical protein